MKSALFFILLAIWGFIGWVINIFEMFSMMGDPRTGEFILKIIGIPVFPIGIFMGWF